MPRDATYDRFASQDDSGLGTAHEPVAANHGKRRAARDCGLSRWPRAANRRRRVDKRRRGELGDRRRFALTRDPECCGVTMDNRGGLRSGDSAEQRI